MDEGPRKQTTFRKRLRTRRLLREGEKEAEEKRIKY